MRRIISGMFMTLDGVVQGPEQWNPPYYNEEMTEVVQAQIATADVHLYGRTTYELFRSVFTGPSAGNIPHAEMMTNTPKIVVSTTLKNPDWGPTTLINGDVVAELSKLKEMPGRDISVGASGTLVRFLLQTGLLDELSLLVHPVVVGSGKRLFEGGERQVPLELIGSRTLTTGVVVMNYRPLANSSE